MAHNVDVNSINSHLMVFRAVQLSLIFNQLQKTLVETAQRSMYRKIEHTLHNLQFIRTRKLSYRKDDRAMCAIYGCSVKIFESPPSVRPRLLFRKFLMGFCFGDRSYEYKI